MRIVAISAFLAFVTLPLYGQTLHPTTGSFSSGGKAITIERFDPPGKGLHTAVLLVHGSGGAGGDLRTFGLFEALTSAGYSVFLPHYFDGEGDWRPGEVKQFFGYIRTLNDAAQYAVSQPNIRPGEIGLVGFSLGGYLVVGLAEEELSHPPPKPPPTIKVVVEMFGGIPQFAISRMTSMPPILILHGEDDDTVPVAQAHELSALLDQKKLPYEIKIYPGQGHGFSGAALTDSFQRTTAFLKAHLD